MALDVTTRLMDGDVMSAALLSSTVSLPRSLSLSLSLSRSVSLFLFLLHGSTIVGAVRALSLSLSIYLSLSLSLSRSRSTMSTYFLFSLSQLFTIFLKGGRINDATYLPGAK